MDKLQDRARRIAAQRCAISNTEDGARRAAGLIEARNRVILELVAEIDRYERAEPGEEQVEAACNRFHAGWEVLPEEDKIEPRALMHATLRAAAAIRNLKETE